MASHRRLSGMQKQILGLYRGFLRAARLKASEERQRIESIVSSEFRHYAKDVDRKNTLYIEYLMRRGKRQLDQLNNPDIVGLSSVKLASSATEDPGDRMLDPSTTQSHCDKSAPDICKYTTSTTPPKILMLRTRSSTAPQPKGVSYKTLVSRTRKSSAKEKHNTKKISSMTNFPRMIGSLTNSYRVRAYRLSTSWRS